MKTIKVDVSSCINNHGTWILDMIMKFCNFNDIPKRYWKEFKDGRILTFNPYKLWVKEVKPHQFELFMSNTNDTRPETGNRLIDFGIELKEQLSMYDESLLNAYEGQAVE